MKDAAWQPIDLRRSEGPPETSHLLNALALQKQSAENVANMTSMPEADRTFYRGKAAGIEQAAKAVELITELHSERSCTICGQPILLLGEA